MGFSPLADMKRRIPDVGRSSPRLYAISGVGVHYQYGKNIHSEATNPAREVSANYWIDDDGTIRPNIDESRRAWTSGDPAYPAGALADHRNITVEVSCVGERTDRISDAALDALARLMGDVYRRYKLGPVKRGADKGVGVHRDWVATACPGNYMMNQLASVIAKAEQYRTTGGGLTVSEADRIIKELKAHISKGNEITRGPSHLGRISRILGGTVKGESIHSKLNRVLGGISGLDLEVNLDPVELADAIADELEPRLSKIDAEKVVDELSKRLGKK